VPTPTYWAAPRQPFSATPKPLLRIWKRPDLFVRDRSLGKASPGRSRSFASDNMKALNMNKLPALVPIFLALTVVSAFAQSAKDARSSNQTTRDRLVGGWRLVWLEEADADGKAQRPHCTGLLVYTADGHMSVQVMYRNTQPANQEGQVQYAQGGYEATFGTYTIDERVHTFTLHVEGAMVRSLVGKDLVRTFEFSGKQMIVKAANPHEHWRVAWERY
jgi:hypothetical protein